MHGAHWGNRLSSGLKDKSLPWSMVAGPSGISRSGMRDWTAGSTPRNLVAVTRLRDELKVDYCRLLTGEPN